MRGRQNTLFDNKLQDKITFYKIMKQIYQKNCICLFYSFDHFHFGAGHGSLTPTTSDGSCAPEKRKVGLELETS